MADREIFQFDGRYPLAAGLDDVLGAIGDLHVAVRVDVGDVAGIEPAILVELLLAGSAVIGARDRRSPHLQAAEGFAVPGLLDVVVVGHLHFDAERRMALLLLDIEALFAVERPCLPASACPVCRAATSRSCPRRG